MPPRLASTFRIAFKSPGKVDTPDETTSKSDFGATGWSIERPGDIQKTHAVIKYIDMQSCIKKICSFVKGMLTSSDNEVPRTSLYGYPPLYS
jgi:hypothetical protein